MRSWAIAIAAMLLASCSRAPEYLHPQNPVAARNPIFATQLAGPSTFLPPLPTAVVVLGPGDLNRNRAFCNALAALPAAQQVLSDSVLAPNVILTRWPVQLAEVSVDQATNCDFLVGSYDYARMARLRRSVNLSEGSLSGPGPLLLLFIPDEMGVHVAGLDGSAYSEAEFPRFIATWTSVLHQTEISVYHAPDQPGVVRSVFNLIFAVLRTVSGAATGLIRGVIYTL